MDIKVITEGHEVLTSGTVFIQKNKFLELNIGRLIYRLYFENNKNRNGEISNEIDEKSRTMKLTFYLDSNVISTSTGFINIGCIEGADIYINLIINGNFTNEGKIIQYTIAKKEED